MRPVGVMAWPGATLSPMSSAANGLGATPPAADADEGLPEASLWFTAPRSPALVRAPTPAPAAKCDKSYGRLCDKSPGRKCDRARVATRSLSGSTSTLSASAASSSAKRLATQPVASTCGRWASAAAWRTAFLTFASASPVTAHVLTTTRSADSSSTSSQPAATSSPAMASSSTLFTRQPRFETATRGAWPSGPAASAPAATPDLTSRAFRARSASWPRPRGPGAGRRCRQGRPHARDARHRHPRQRRARRAPRPSRAARRAPRP